MKKKYIKTKQNKSNHIKSNQIISNQDSTKNSSKQIRTNQNKIRSFTVYLNQIRQLNFLPSTSILRLKSYLEFFNYFQDNLQFNFLHSLRQTVTIEHNLILHLFNNVYIFLYLTYYLHHHLFLYVIGISSSIRD